MVKIVFLYKISYIEKWKTKFFLRKIKNSFLKKMAPKFAPKVWKRPYTSIYNDNYRYGNSLYSDAITDIERKYNEAIGVTRLRSDRPDLGLSTFSDSQLTGESASARHRATAASENYSNERIRSISLTRVNSYLDDSERKLAHSPSFDTYSSHRALEKIHSDIEESRLRRTGSRRTRDRRPDSAIFATNPYEHALLKQDNNSGPAGTFWMERWYRNSMRSVARDLYPTNSLKTICTS